LLEADEAEQEFGIKVLRKLAERADFDGIILAVPHDIFTEEGQEISLDKLEKITGDRPVLLDVKRCFDAGKAQDKGFAYLTL